MGGVCKKHDTRIISAFSQATDEGNNEDEAFVSSLLYVLVG